VADTLTRIEALLTKLEHDADMLDRRAEHIEYALRTLIVWMSGSAASPIRRDEAEKLLQMLEGKEARRGKT
jgi:hypothetical protein